MHRMHIFITKYFSTLLVPKEEDQSTSSGVVAVHLFISSIHLYYGHKPSKLFVSWNYVIITGTEEVGCLEVHNFAFKDVNCQGWRCILTVTVVLVLIGMGLLQTVSRSDLLHQRRKLDYLTLEKKNNTQGNESDFCCPKLMNTINQHS